MARVTGAALVCLLTCALTSAQELTREQMEAFLQTAKVVRYSQISKGITRPYRLTLSDGTLTHDGVFQSVDEKKAIAQMQRGTEINFVDSWRYNVAAWRLGDLIGLGAMLPVTVEREWQGKHGALSWFLASQMDEAERLKKKVSPPDPVVWNQDMLRLRVFTELIADTDRNLGNVLVSPDWRVLMVDFSRAFRLHPAFRPKELTQCDRALLARLQALTAEEVSAAAGEYLTKWEVDAVMKRRDLIVAHFQKLIAAKGEEKILY